MLTRPNASGPDQNPRTPPCASGASSTRFSSASRRLLARAASFSRRGTFLLPCALRSGAQAGCQRRSQVVGARFWPHERELGLLALLLRVDQREQLVAIFVAVCGGIEVGFEHLDQLPRHVELFRIER